MFQDVTVIDEDTIHWNDVELTTRAVSDDDTGKRCDGCFLRSQPPIRGCHLVPCCPSERGDGKRVVLVRKGL